MKGKSKPSVLVCVTGQRDCDRLIRVGKQMAEESGACLQVLCVQPTANGFHVGGQEIEYLYQTTREAGAEMTIYFHDDAALIAAGFVKQGNAHRVVTGMPDGRANGFVETIHQLVPKVTISMVSKDETVYNMMPQQEPARRKPALA